MERPTKLQRQRGPSEGRKFSKRRKSYKDFVCNDKMLVNKIRKYSKNIKFRKCRKSNEDSVSKTKCLLTRIVNIARITNLGNGKTDKVTKEKRAVGRPRNLAKFPKVVATRKSNGTANTRTYQKALVCSRQVLVLSW